MAFGSNSVCSLNRFLFLCFVTINTTAAWPRAHGGGCARLLGKSSRARGVWEQLPDLSSHARVALKQLPDLSSGAREALVQLLGVSSWGVGMASQCVRPWQRGVGAAPWCVQPCHRGVKRLPGVSSRAREATCPVVTRPQAAASQAALGKVLTSS